VTTVPAERPPQRRPTLRTVTAGTMLVLGLGLGTAVWSLSDRVPHAAAADRARGQQRDLTVSGTVPTRTTRAGFTVRLPSAPLTVAHRNPDGSETVLTANVSGTQPAGLVIVAGLPGARDPRSSLEQVRAGLRSTYGITVGKSVRTRLAGRPAFEVTYLLPSGQQVREWRLQRDGVSFGVRLLCDPTDRVALDTGLAALATWRWSE
jgi:hypothetical protein